MKIIKIAFIGLGLHARSYHYPILERISKTQDIKVQLIIDLKDQKQAIEEYLQKFSLKPKKLIYLPDSYRVSAEMPPEAEQVLNETLRSCGIDGIIISTEPKSHKAYALWGIKNNVDVLMDKPITAPVMVQNTQEEAFQIYRDFQDVERVMKNSTSNVTVLAPRRYHPGMQYLYDYAKKIVEEYQIPLTYVDVYHAEGQWNMPDEFFYRENHPYKYGYGMVLHSGYHHIDLMNWFESINELIPQYSSDEIEISTRHITPADFMFQINPTAYQKMFGENPYDKYYQAQAQQQATKFGETDIIVLSQYKRHGLVISTSLVSMLQTSFSRRAWLELPENTYKNNGRLRHERVNLQIGTLVNLQAHSYQDGNTTGFSNVNENKNGIPAFKILVYRNSALIGGRTYEEVNIDDSYQIELNGKIYHSSLYGAAREYNIQDWLAGKRGKNFFLDHQKTDRIVSAVYESIFKQNNGEVPVTKIIS